MMMDVYKSVNTSLDKFILVKPINSFILIEIIKTNLTAFLFNYALVFPAPIMFIVNICTLLVKMLFQSK